MKYNKLLPAILVMAGLCQSLHAQNDTLWTRTFGGIYNDGGYSVQQTFDGGFIVTGSTDSYGAGLSDVYLIRTDANGDTLWTRTYGGDELDVGSYVQQTFDGGFVVTGISESFGEGWSNVYLIRTDENGDTLWTRTYGGNEWSSGYSVQQTADSGFVVAGYTMSFGAGESDFYLVRTDTQGDTLWTRTYGGLYFDEASSVQQTFDGGFVIAGMTDSFGSGNSDFYLVRTDANGDILWTRTFGSTSYEWGSYVQQTTDSGFVVAGTTDSFGGGITSTYLIRTDANGDTLWTRYYRGDDMEYGRVVQQTTDGGFMVAGTVISYSSGGSNVHLIRTDAQGDTLWTRAYGGPYSDEGYSVQQTDDGGFVVAGTTDSFGAGMLDLWLIRIPVFHPPLAVNDDANTSEDTSVTITVLTNDSDVDGNPLSVLSVTQGYHGAVVIDAGDTTVTYTPAANFFGVDSFKYAISNGTLTDTATVTITVGSVNDPPVLADLPDLYFNEDDSTHIDLDQYVSDVDHDTTAITITAAVIGAAALGPYSIHSSPGGEFRIDVGTGDLVISIDPVSHVAAISVATDSSGSFTVVFTATDDSLATDTDTLAVTVAPLNDTPMAVDDAITTAEDTPVSVEVLTNDKDVENDTLHVLWISQGTSGAVVIDPGDTTVTYSPAADFFGPDSFEYAVRDGALSDTAIVTVTITPVNDSPVALADTIDTPEDSPVTIILLTNDSDVDADPLTVLWISQGAAGAVAIVPGDTTVTYTPAADFFGADSFEYAVNDGALSDTAMVIVNVRSVNDPPELAGLSDLYFNEDDSTQFDLDHFLSDVDHDSLEITFSAAVIGAEAQGPVQVSTGPGGDFRIDVGAGDLMISIDSASHLATITVAADSSGFFTVVFTATDDSLAADTDTMVVTVAPENDAPVAVDDAVNTPQDSTVTIPVLSNDFDVDDDILSIVNTSQGSHGDVTIDAGDSTVTYTPEQKFNGVDRFFYVITDDSGRLDSAEVVVTVGTKAPHIISVMDVSDDQGRQVYVSWDRSYLDLHNGIIQYGIKLRNPEGTWVSLGSVAAEQADSYTYLADTFGDSSALGTVWSRFQVTAHTGTDIYTSPVDSGYSIDNLAPAMPTGLVALVIKGLAVSLAWNGPVDYDFDFFRVYRQPIADTVATALTETYDPAFTDTTAEEGEIYHYWVSALDVNGNESGNSQPVSVTVLGLEGGPGLPTEFALHANYPNPFNPTTTIAYDLPQAGPVTLIVYDLRGREIVGLAEGQREAGYHQVTWAGRNAAGREVPTGIYIARLSTPAYTKSIKMLLLK